MPIYEYRCQSCEKELEVLVRGGKEPQECPACQGQLARKISRAGVIFKGSGFYVNDSRGSNGASKSSSSGSTDGSKKDSAGGTESSKPASDSTSSSKSESSSSKAAD